MMKTTLDSFRPSSQQNYAVLVCTIRNFEELCSVVVTSKDGGQRKLIFKGAIISCGPAQLYQALFPFVRPTLLEIEL